MTLIDLTMNLTSEFAPVLIGLNALFALSTAMVFGPPALDALVKTFRRSTRPRLVLTGPALAR